MKILSYNLWNSFARNQLWRVCYLESESRRKKRIEIQEDLLKAVFADIYCFQELSPVSRASSLARALGCRFMLQRDQAGMKLGRIGLPFNFDNSLAIMAKPEWKLKPRKRLKLSGHFGGFITSFRSFQLSEFRYAIFANIFHPHYGKILIVNTHLHHGPQWSLQLEESLENLLCEDKITQRQYEDFRNKMNHSLSRRTQEINRLYVYLKKFGKGTPHIILCGDFNSENESSILKLQDYPLHDVGKAYLDQATWDYRNNQENHKLCSNMDIFLDRKKRNAAHELMVEMECKRPRRIDYIFLSESLFEKVKSLELFGTEAKDGIVASDHYGLLLEIED